MSTLWLRVKNRRGVASRREAPVAVVLASAGAPISEVAIDRACSLADGAATAVASIAKVHGSAFGLPNPGLLPTRREREEQRTIVATAVNALERRGLEADGEVIVTRNAGRSIARLARARGARYVVLQVSPQGRLRRLLEGDPARVLRRRHDQQPTLVLITDQADPSQPS
jgi:nucleotide-binding universal stress UspA family protein